VRKKGVGKLHLVGLEKEIQTTGSLNVFEKTFVTLFFRATATPDPLLNHRNSANTGLFSASKPMKQSSVPRVR
jgi:hypothetical protein